MTLRRRLRRLLRGGPARSDNGADRWVVVDVESSGLDPERDRLIAVGAIAIHWTHAGARAPSIAIGDSFEAVLRQPESAVDKHNILVHGVGVGAQRGGLDPHAALAAFEAWSDGAPLLAFHAPFDQRLLARAAREVLGHTLENEWLDLAPLAGVLWPDVPARSLDDWIHHFGLLCLARHLAIADALVTAELFLRLYPALETEVGAGPGFRKLKRLAAQRRWLP
ncbi:MAG: 3'-5' exonuclease [Caldimonas sp.]